MRHVFATTLILALGLLPGWAQTLAQAPAPPEAVTPPMEITADTLDYDLNRRQADFRGSVKVVDQSLQLQAEDASVRFDEDNQPLRITAVGDVQVRKGDIEAQSGKASYDVTQGVIAFTEKPVLRNERGVIRDADALLYRRFEETFVTRGGRPRLSVRKGTENAEFDVFGREADGAAAGNVEIVADGLQYLVAKNRVVFRGDVRVVDDQTNIRADVLEVHLGDHNDIRRLVAEGNVEIRNQENRATGGKADYDLPASRLVLSDSPVLYQGKSRIINADFVHYDREAGRFYTRGGRPLLEVVDQPLEVDRLPRPPAP